MINFARPGADQYEDVEEEGMPKPCAMGIPWVNPDSHRPQRGATGRAEEVLKVYLNTRELLPLPMDVGTSGGAIRQRLVKVLPVSDEGLYDPTPLTSEHFIYSCERRFAAEVRVVRRRSLSNSGCDCRRMPN